MSVANTPEEALANWDDNPSDLIIIDDTNSTAAAIQLCRRLRAVVANPILFLTDDGRESNQLVIYEAGADECIVKPIGVQLLMTKINTWLRHSWHVPTETLNTLQTGSFQLDSVRRSLIIEGEKQVKLTNLEFRLIHLLFNNPGRALESSLIVSRVWGHSGEGDSTLLKHVVYRLRRKIEPNPGEPRYLQTAPGEGYIFQP